MKDNMKTYCNYSDIEMLCLNVVKQISRDQWVPDYVVGITRGGLIPAVLLSNWFDCKMQTLKVSLRDDAECESNCWMAEEAVGYVPMEERGESGTTIDPSYRKNILIVDDINDTGSTLNWIKQDWQSSVFPKNSAWDAVWDNNVRVAVLYNKESSRSEINVRYSGTDITEDNDPGWIVFPWESWCGE
jgi:hypoxanthine phosphoribosyltransferase